MQPSSPAATRHGIDLHQAYPGTGLLPDWAQPARAATLAFSSSKALPHDLYQVAHKTQRSAPG